MSIKLHKNYLHGLREAKPSYIHGKVIYPPHGSLGAIRVIKPQIIPSINTNINFSELTPFNLSSHPGIARMSMAEIPQEFNWRRDHPDSKDSQSIKKKRKLISTPGNQALCGSCWEGNFHLTEKKIRLIIIFRKIIIQNNTNFIFITRSINKF